ncbi:MAG: hypothetical protein ABSG44_07990 [Thermodesulfobacteriota bacterium]|jgi:hypothetical protein
MEEKEFTHKFPEWVLSASLAEACKLDDTPTYDTSKFWSQLNVVRDRNDLDKSKTFSELFHLPSSKPPMLYPEKAFAIEDAEYYGIRPDIFRSTFWSLRPDFLIQNKELSLIILLEAKGGEVPPKAWRDPKELRYYDFLCKCSLSYKGFYYIIPQKSYGDCKRCLSNPKYFEPKKDIQTGMIFWEGLLDIIDDDLMKTSLDQVLRETEGLKTLREWQKDKIGKK